jgi:dienelactone hydrolase
MRKLWLILLIGLTACGGSATPTATPRPVPVTIATFTPPPAASPTRAAQATARASPLPLPTPAEPVNLTIPSGGAQLAATYYPPADPAAESAPGVLLLHMLGGCACRKDWDAFARELQKRGYAALAFDFRGHGDTPGPEDWMSKSPGDVRAALEFLKTRPEVDQQAIGLVGASIGSNLALIVGANNPDVGAVAALSPGVDYHGLQPALSMGNFDFNAQSVLLVASQEDTYSYNTVTALAAQYPLADTEYLANSGHGTEMLSNPAFVEILLTWLDTHVAILKG